MSAPEHQPAEPGDRGYPPGVIRLGRFLGIDVLLQPSWLVVAALLSFMLASNSQISDLNLGGWRYVAAFIFVVALYVTIFVHEVSHALMARRLGMPVRWISLNFLGGLTALEGEAASPMDSFKIAVVGPVTSLAIGAVAVGATFLHPHGFLGVLVEGLAWSNVAIGVLNLIPGFPLDGGRILHALAWRWTGSQDRALLIAGQVGRAAVILFVVVPLLVVPRESNPLFSALLTVVILASFVWLGSSAAIRTAKLRMRLPALQARQLARPVIVVPGDLSIAEAVRRAGEAQAGGILTHASDDSLTGIVSESALLAVPERQRPWQAISTVARRVEDGLVLAADIGGQDLVAAIGNLPAEEYVLVEPDRSIYGVLVTRDVDRAYRAATQGKQG
ncbi:MAG: site-2 protease family protein, partial [Marmoricola sp.]